MSISANDRILVIGYGNTLRGDDALGWLVAHSLVDKNWENVLSVSVTQLIPELATLIASARAVIFVDACVTEGQVDVRALRPACPLGRQIHRTGPRELLALARSCYDRTPPAWLVTVPGSEFGISDRLSEPAQDQLACARLQVQSLIDRILDRRATHA